MVVARAVLFDIDGTLVDSVDLHARAWQEALRHHGKDVPYDEIRAQMGKDGDRLLPAFLSGEDLERFADDLDEHRTAIYQRKYLPRARAFPQARELLARLKQAGTAVGLASTCKRVELGYYLRMVGGASLVDAATAADDADRSTPSPNVFEACREKLDVEARDAVAVCDSPHDAEAASRAGIAVVGVLSGGFPRRALEAAGCIAIYQDMADLLERLASSPLAPESPAQRR